MKVDIIKVLIGGQFLSQFLPAYEYIHEFKKFEKLFG